MKKGRKRTRYYKFPKSWRNAKKQAQTGKRPPANLRAKAKRMRAQL